MKLGLAAVAAGWRHFVESPGAQTGSTSLTADAVVASRAVGVALIIRHRPGSARSAGATDPDPAPNPRRAR